MQKAINMNKLRNLFLLLAAIPLLSSCGYNTMVEKSETVDSQWSQVETQYQRRSDLIPNLVNTVKGYADFEKSTLTAVMEARSKATQVSINPGQLNESSMSQFKQAQGELGGALSRLLVTVERYPELKANQNFLELQAQLEGTENRINVARMKYNESVKDYNAYTKKFPQLIIAKWFDFTPKPYFEADEGSEKAPQVQF